MEDITAIHSLIAMKESVTVQEPVIMQESVTVQGPVIIKPFIVQTNAQMDKQRSNIEALFDSIQQNFAQIKTSITDFQGQLRNLEKSVKTEIKNETKKRDPVPVPVPVKLADPVKTNTLKQTKITGFDITEKITPELAVFMKIPAEQKATRNSVIQYITEYIRQNKLQDMSERKKINLNAELSSLFRLTIDKDQTQLTYFNLQKHINALFL